MIFRSARSETEGRVLQYTVGPYWDGSEVWFVTAGGATFAAFPLVFAEMFSHLYIALFLLLFMLIIRAVCMELVYKDDDLTWQRGMAWGWVLSSYGLALLLGVRFTNLFLKTGTNLFNGAAFTAAPILWVLPVATIMLPAVTVVLLWRGRYGWAFISNLGAVALFMGTGFTGTYPYMVPGITLFEGMAGLSTLKVMTVVVGIFLPMILAYQTWKFIRFRRAIEMDYFA